MTQPVRIEHDLLGERAVPADAYYGIHTLRALENFSITGMPISIYPDLVAALACVKQAAAIANSELGLLEEKRAVAIQLACEEVREGKLFAFEVIGNDITVTMAAEAGQLQLNAFEPIIAHSLFEGLQHLTAGCRTLAERCVKGISANRQRARRLLDEGLMTKAQLDEVLRPEILTRPHATAIQKPRP
ncbi:MAG: lyase family protein [Betaproteobacteria bacterium]